MDVHSLLRHIDFRDRRTLYIALTAPIVGYYAARTISGLLAPRRRQANSVLASPRKSLQLLSAQNLDDLPYRPDALPGARDVDTPYGNIRVYEWGPEDGRKVLFIHGISTPCIAFAGMAERLVEQGCRVMLFDLFGRGYSDTPDPEVYRQDIRLFTTQILLVLASSPLAWTGKEGRFSLVGYSLGGGVGAAFTSYFPHLVESLILIAPAGLIRSKHIAASSKLLYGNLLPHWLVNYYVRGRLFSGRTTPLGLGKSAVAGKAITPANVAESEVPATTHPAHAENSSAPMFPGRPNISPVETVAWQVDNHPGFLPSFISSIKYAPVRDEHARWMAIGRRQSAARASEDQAVKAEGLKEGKVLVLLGKQDQVIVAQEVEEDATEVLGRENVKCVTLEGGHDVPIVNAQGCADAILEFWECLSGRERGVETAEVA